MHRWYIPSRFRIDLLLFLLMLCDEFALFVKDEKPVSVRGSLTRLVSIYTRAGAIVAVGERVKRIFYKPATLGALIDRRSEWFLEIARRHCYCRDRVSGSMDVGSGNRQV